MTWVVKKGDRYLSTVCAMGEPSHEVWTTSQKEADRFYSWPNVHFVSTTRGARAVRLKPRPTR